MSCFAKAPDGTHCNLAPGHLEQGYSHHSLESGLLWDDDEYSYRAKVADLVKAAEAAAVKLRDNQASGSERRMAADDLAKALKPFEGS